MVIVVLGSHGSGTTLIGQMLHLSGVNMGSFDVGMTYDDGNQYERHRVVAINRRLLEGSLIHTARFHKQKSFLPEVNQAGYAPNQDSLSIVRKLPAKLPLQEQKEMERLVQDLDEKYKDWGFKDPRTCLTYHLWHEVLPQHKVIIIYRDYKELLQRYHLVGWRMFNIPRYFRLLHVWTFYNLSIMKYLELFNVPAIVISHRHLMQDPAEFNRLESFVDRELMDLRDPTLYRSHASTGYRFRWLESLLQPFLPEPSQKVYQILEQKRRSMILNEAGFCKHR